MSADGDPVARFVLTGAPGAGKTAVLRALSELGYEVVPEAATDVIAARQAQGAAEPWLDRAFTDQIAALQRDRQRAAPDGGIQFYDRSPVCTLALARYLGHPAGPVLTAELERIAAEGAYQLRVFFIRTLGFITPTPARRISYAESLEFERVHEAEYRRLGFDLVDVPAAAVAGRAAKIAAQVSSRQPGAPSGGSRQR
jgi:predicted ATPase